MADQLQPTAAAKVFAIPELVEDILIKLDSLYPHQLFVMQRVSSTFKSVIEGSKPIRRAMYLEASEEDGTTPKINPLIMVSKDKHPTAISFRPPKGAEKGTGGYDMTFEKHELADDCAFKLDADGCATSGCVRLPPTWDPAAGSWRRMVIWNKRRTTKVIAGTIPCDGDDGPGEYYRMGPACRLKDLFDVFEDNDGLKGRASKTYCDDEMRRQTYVFD